MLLTFKTVAKSPILGGLEKIIGGRPQSPGRRNPAPLFNWRILDPGDFGNWRIPPDLQSFSRRRSWPLYTPHLPNNVMSQSLEIRIST
jgi:hypothetical protein